MVFLPLEERSSEVTKTMEKNQNKSGDPSLGLEKQETSLGVSSEIKRGEVV